MKGLLLALLACLVLGLSACSGSTSGKQDCGQNGDKKGTGDDDKKGVGNADKILGTWEAVNSADLPPESKAIIEFTKGGTFKRVDCIEGKTRTWEGIYKVLDA